MFQTSSIRAKLFAAFVGTGVLSILVLAWLGHSSSKQALTETVHNQLISIRETRALEVESYFQTIRNQVLSFSENSMIVDAMVGFKEAFHTEGNRIVPSELTPFEPALRNTYHSVLLKKLKENGEEATLDTYWPQDPVARYFQHHYISNNPHPTGSKHYLDTAEDGSTYSALHARVHPIIRNFLERFGYYDIFLVDAETGHIVYSVYKELDYGTSLRTGPYRTTNFARVYEAARTATSSDFVQLADFEPYAPSYNAPASFIASPIFDGDTRVGVLVFQMPIDAINSLMTANYAWTDYGLGETGESYLVGSDFTMRSTSRFLVENPEAYLQTLQSLDTPQATLDQIRHHETSILFQEIRTVAVNEALKGQTGIQTIRDYRTVPVLSAFTPLQIADVNWVLVAEMDEAEAYAASTRLGWLLLVTAIGILALLLVTAWLLSRSFARPIVRLQHAARAIAQGDTAIRMNSQRHDELGELFEAFDDMVEQIDASQATIAAEKAAAQAHAEQTESMAAEARAQEAYLTQQVEHMLATMNRFADGDLTVRLTTSKHVALARLFTGFNQAVEKIHRVIEHVRSAVDSTTQAATQISAATETLSAGAQEQSVQAGEVAVAMEEMTRTIAENSAHAATTAQASAHSGQVACSGGDVVTQTVGKIRDIAAIVEASAATVERLGASSEQIGQIVSVISDIAEQTNLLALNAAIEAARAGEHGRGFAVVADEVRQLAAKTANATQQIGQMIQTIQGETRAAIGAMTQGRSEVSTGIALADEAGTSLQQVVQEAQHVVELINQMAAANEEQAVTSSEITRSVEAIHSVSEAAAQGLTDIAHSAETLNELTDTLNSLVQAFQVEPATEAQQPYRGPRSLQTTYTPTTPFGTPVPA